MKFAGSAPVRSFKSLFAKYIFTARSNQAGCLLVLCNSSAGAGSQPICFYLMGPLLTLIPASVLHPPKRKLQAQMIPKFYMPEKTLSQLA